MPGMTGEELAVVVKERCTKTAVILLTGFGGGTADTEDVAPAWTWCWANPRPPWNCAGPSGSL